MKLPTIHLNGSSPRTMLDDCCEDMAALRHTIRLLESHGPNGRDYYTQLPNLVDEAHPVDAFEVARAEHVDRLKRLQSVLRELETLAEHLSDAMAHRSRR